MKRQRRTKKQIDKNKRRIELNKEAATRHYLDCAWCQLFWRQCRTAITLWQRMSS